MYTCLVCLLVVSTVKRHQCKGIQFSVTFWPLDIYRFYRIHHDWTQAHFQCKLLLWTTLLVVVPCSSEIVVTWKGWQLISATLAATKKRKGPLRVNIYIIYIYIHINIHIYTYTYIYIYIHDIHGLVLLPPFATFILRGKLMYPPHP